MGCSRIRWLVETMEAVLQVERQTEFIKQMREGNGTFMAQPNIIEVGREF